MTAPRMNTSSMGLFPTRLPSVNHGSAPGLAAKMYRLFVERASATAPSVDQAAIFLIGGHPILITPSKSRAEESVKVKLEVVSPVAQLDAIKDFLGLTVTQIAELFKVTRKTVYDWYDGADPRPVITARIRAVHHVLRVKAPTSDLKCLKQCWHLPLGGASFIDLLNATTDQHWLEPALEQKLDELKPRMIQHVATSQVGSRASKSAVISEIVRDADSR